LALVQSTFAKWGTNSVLLAFLVPKWGIQFIFCPKK
jgi:hypothetical protein